MDDEYEDPREIAGDLIDRPGMTPRRRKRATLDGEDPRKLADDIRSLYRDNATEED